MTKEIVFYNKEGTPVAYTENEEDIYLFSGEPVGYIHEDSIYSYSGKHIGWYEGGWVRDSYGSCVFFTNDSVGGPFKPFKAFAPFKGFKGFKPLKGLKELRPFKPMKVLGWSEFEDERIFYQ